MFACWPRRKSKTASTCAPNPRDGRWKGSGSGDCRLGNLPRQPGAGQIRPSRAKKKSIGSSTTGRARSKRRSQRRVQERILVQTTTSQEMASQKMGSQKMGSRLSRPPLAIRCRRNPLSRFLPTPAAGRVWLACSLKIGIPTPEPLKPAHCRALVPKACRDC